MVGEFLTQITRSAAAVGLHVVPGKCRIYCRSQHLLQQAQHTLSPEFTAHFAPAALATGAPPLLHQWQEGSDVDASKGLLSLHGMRMLGGYLGTAAFRGAAVGQLVQRHAASIAALDSMQHSQHILQCLRMCCHIRLSHHMRLMHAAC